MWNAISQVQDLNSCRRVHFLRRKPLHHGHLNMYFQVIMLQIQPVENDVQVKNDFHTIENMHFTKYFTFWKISSLKVIRYKSNILIALIEWGINWTILEFSIRQAINYMHPPLPGYATMERSFSLD